MKPGASNTHDHETSLVDLLLAVKHTNMQIWDDSIEFLSQQRGILIVETVDRNANFKRGWF